MEELFKCIRIVIVVHLGAAAIFLPPLLSCPIKLIHELNFPFWDINRKGF